MIPEACVCLYSSEWGSPASWGDAEGGDVHKKCERQGKKVLDKFISLFLLRGCFLVCGVCGFLVACLWGGFIVFWFVWWSLPAPNELSFYLLCTGTN